MRKILVAKWKRVPWALGGLEFVVVMKSGCPNTLPALAPAYNVFALSKRRILGRLQKKRTEPLYLSATKSATNKSPFIPVTALACVMMDWDAVFDPAAKLGCPNTPSACAPVTRKKLGSGTQLRPYTIRLLIGIVETQRAMI